MYSSWLIAKQNIVRSPARFAASVAAIAISVMLVWVGCGLYVGLLDGIVSYPRSLEGDLVVIEEGASVSLGHFASKISDETVRTIEGMAGVDRVAALYGRPVLFEIDEQEALVYTVGLYRNESFGGPVLSIEGDARPRLNEIVIDRVFAHDFGLEVGDTLRKGSISLEVAGIASGGNAIIGTYAFVHRGDLMLAGVTQPATLFVSTDEPEALDALAARIDNLPGLAVLPRARFLDANREVARRVVLPVIALLVGIGIVVAIAVVALALYTSTIERRTEFGLLDALGLPPVQRYGIVLIQSSLATIAGLLVGLALGAGIANAFVEIEPRFLVSVPTPLMASIAAGTVVVGLIASLLPVRLLARIDPGMVFRV